MTKFHCNECSTDFDGNQNACPTCGCPKEDCTPVNNERPVAAVAPDTDEQDFNEHYEYSPFSANSWYTRAPWPLNKYPRRAFAAEHPFLGWLFDPWHLTCRDASKQEQYDTANNIFYMFNLYFKANVYALCYAFFKVWWIFLLLFAVLFVLGTLAAQSYSYASMAFIGIAGTIGYIVLAIVAGIAWCWGMGQALHRYWPSFHKTWRRVNKRYWNAMK